VELLVAYQNDPAGYNMAKFLSKNMHQDGEIFHGKQYDLLIISTPSIEADWLEEKYNYDGFVFLSKHAAESGVLALTCHSTGNFSEAKFGGKKREVAIPHPFLQKEYLKTLWENKNQFTDFQITLEATHHGPTSLTKPTIFIEIGTTEKQWNNISLCNSVAVLLEDVLSRNFKTAPVAICFGGTHYPEKFTNMLIEGSFALGTITPKHALDEVDQKLFEHILSKNKLAKAALLDWNGLGPNKQKIINFLDNTDLEVIKL
jgi:D-aminoacyl-tRNA deacylase